ncbi:MAG TPA: hypothetical protein VFZ64_14015 [Nocardioidaceae bacterium]
MQIPRQTVVDLLRNEGDEGTATQFESEAPETVDTDQHADLLERYGVNLDDIAGGKAGVGDEVGFNQAHDLRRGTDIGTQARE